MNYHTSGPPRAACAAAMALLSSQRWYSHPLWSSGSVKKAFLTSSNSSSRVLAGIAAAGAALPLSASAISALRTPDSHHRLFSLRIV